MLLVDINLAAAEKTLALVQERFPNVKAAAIKADVGKEADVKAAVDKAVELFGRLDIMVRHPHVLRSTDLCSPLPLLAIHPALFCRAIACCADTWMPSSTRLSPRRAVQQRRCASSLIDPYLSRTRPVHAHTISILRRIPAALVPAPRSSSGR